MTSRYGKLNLQELKNFGYKERVRRKSILSLCQSLSVKMTETREIRNGHVLNATPSVTRPVPKSFLIGDTDGSRVSKLTLSGDFVRRSSSIDRSTSYFVTLAAPLIFCSRRHT